MKKKFKVTIICTIVIIFLLELFFTANYLLVNREIDSIEMKQEELLTSLTELNKFTLEEQFNNRNEIDKLNKISKNIDYSTHIKSVFVNKSKKSDIKKRKNEIESMLVKLNSENNILNHFNTLLKANPFFQNKTLSKLDIDKYSYENIKIELSEEINDLVSSEKKEILLDLLEQVNNENLRKQKLIALTFDDGPNDDSTLQALNILKKYNIKATFFILGSMAEKYPETLIKIKADGHEIGNHGYSHKELTSLTKEEIQKEILGTNLTIKKILGEEPKVWRPPYGSYNEATQEIANMRMMLWNVDSLDWKSKNSNQTLYEITNNVKEGDIVLMHDIQKTTVDILENLIIQLKEEGYSFTLASELPTE